MKINRSNIVKSFCAILLMGIIAVSCGQDPIFYIISTETAPIPPRIPGSPTNMVVFEREYQYFGDPADPDFDPDAEPETRNINLLFVASGSLHWYGGDPSAPEWDMDYGIPQPEGRITSLAITKNYLYALCLNGNSLTATLRYMGRTGGWTTISGIDEYPLLQSIYADPETDRLFVGAGITSKTDITYAILYLDVNKDTDEQTLKMLKPKTAMLSGAVYRKDAYYLCTRGQGIFKVSEDNLKTNPINDEMVLQLKNISEVKIETEIDPDNPPDPDNLLEIKIELQEKDSDILFMSMIKLKDSAESIIAVGRANGVLYEILENEEGAAYFSQIYYNNGNSATIGAFAMGAYALWQDRDEVIKKLVTGRQGTLSSTSYNNGYVEFYLKSDNNSFDKDNPTRFMDTVHNSDRYSTNLGKHPINHLFQAPESIDENMTFFASTQASGLWSYRDRPNNGGWQWNAEN